MQHKNELKKKIKFLGPMIGVNGPLKGYFKASLVLFSGGSAKNNGQIFLQALTSKFSL